MAKSETKPAALVVGVGPGLGAALVRRFAREGMGVAIAARRVDKLKDLAAETGGRAYACDATSEISVDDLFTAVERDLGLPRLVVFNAGAFVRKPVVELSPAEVESAWRACCLGGFLVGRAAARAMLPGGPGTILLTGATAALRGSANLPPSPSAFGLGRSAQSELASWGRKGSMSAMSSSTAASARTPSANSRPMPSPRLLAPPQPAQERLDPGARSPALDRGSDRPVCAAGRLSSSAPA
jgi:NAD(P)-dependent dehydrogenase (short-subunit alcohol dehydrogenase family)